MGKKKNFSHNLLLNQNVFTVFLLILIILLSIPLYNNYNRRQKINREILDLETEIKLTENKNTDLQKLIKYLESSQFVEEQARLNLNMKKPGETVAVVKDAPELSQPDARSQQQVSLNQQPAESSPNFGYAMSWWHYFFKL